MEKTYTRHINLHYFYRILPCGGFSTANSYYFVVLQNAWTVKASPKFEYFNHATAHGDFDKDSAPRWTSYSRDLFIREFASNLAPCRHEQQEAATSTKYLAKRITLWLLSFLAASIRRSRSGSVRGTNVARASARL